ncbi:hypothetical protein Tco_1309517, partial [Tanacetum coccineum]
GGPSSFQTHPNSSSFFNIGTPTNWQTPMQSQPGPSNWHSQMPAQSATQIGIDLSSMLILNNGIMEEPK